MTATQLDHSVKNVMNEVVSVNVNQTSLEDNVIIVLLVHMASHPMVVNHVIVIALELKITSVI